MNLTINLNINIFLSIFFYFDQSWLCFNQNFVRKNQSTGCKIKVDMAEWFPCKESSPREITRTCLLGSRPVVVHYCWWYNLVVQALTLSFDTFHLCGAGGKKLSHAVSWLLRITCALDILVENTVYVVKCLSHSCYNEHPNFLVKRNFSLSMFLI